MKIAWFTPFDQKSAIGRAGDSIARELNKNAIVDIWHPAAECLRPTPVRTVRFEAESLDLERLSTYDLLVYNFGNYLPYHKDIFIASRKMPGICVMHDFVMHHFFAAYYLEHLADSKGYVAAMHCLYGEDGRKVAEDSLSGKRHRVWETDDVVRYPLFEDVLKGASGVVAHSDFFVSKVRQNYHGPVRKIPLPYDTISKDASLARSELGITDDQILVVTVGHMNPNKCVHMAVEALGCNRDLLDRVRYVLLGPFDNDYHRKVKGLIEDQGVALSVKVMGYVSDEVLNTHLVHADICINLRNPAMEGASASVIEEMLHGKPVIVYDTGFYHELPDDSVVKIPLNSDSRHLGDALRHLILDDNRRRELGTNARAFAEKTFRADGYATQLLEFAWETRRAKPLLGLAAQVGTELNRMGVQRGMEIVSDVSRACYTMFCPRDE